MLHYLRSLTFRQPFQFEAAAGVDLARDQSVTSYGGFFLSTVAADPTPIAILTQDHQAAESLSDNVGYIDASTFLRQFGTETATGLAVLES